LSSGIPAPIILAIFFQEVRHKRLLGVLQSISYAPNFMSTVVICGIILMFLSPQSGAIPAVLRLLGIPMETNLIAEPAYFWHIYVWSGVWQGVGWGSLIYTAAISGIPLEQYEAATLEGANKMQQIFTVTIPNIMPTIVIISILSIGNIMSVGYEKIFLLQNGTNAEMSEVISTYVYKMGILGTTTAQTGRPRYSFASMVGLFNSVVNMIVLAIVNYTARRFGETSLW
jgi:putative aldouronate transport system permease protein